MSQDLDPEFRVGTIFVMSKVPFGAIPVDVEGLHTPMLGGQKCGEVPGESILEMILRCWLQTPGSVCFDTSEGEIIETRI